MISSLAIYGTLKYIKSLKTTEEEWDPQPEPVIPEPEEDIKIRVDEIENPDFDDHFDLKKREHLLGKTLLKFAQNGLNSSDSVLRDSLMLLGSIYYEKWPLVQSLCANKSAEFSSDCIDECLSYVSILQNVDVENTLKSLKVTNYNVEDSLKKLIEESIKLNQDTVVENQIKKFEHWKTTRSNELNRYYQESLKKSKLQEIEQNKLKLEEEERKLFFFDNYEAMELEKRVKIREWKKTFPRRTFAPKITLGISPPDGVYSTRAARKALKNLSTKK